jgi:WD40 repeat protein
VRTSALIRHAASILAWLAAAACAAATPPTAPQPRVVHDMHGARINQIRATPDLQRLVSVGQDKTLRVWRLSDLHLLRSVPVPAGAGEEGSLRSLVVLPDGREAIVGGWTGLGWSAGAQLYRVQLETGRIVQTLRGLPALVESLALAPDGRRLAVGMGGGAGLRVLELPSGRTLWADAAYGGTVGFADFAPDGTLATTSSDGCLRLYDGAGQLRFRAEYPPRQDGGPACRGSALGGVRFSPDGRQLAFGLQDRVEAVVLDVATQQLLHRLTPDLPGQRALCCANWSSDGRRLHLHGVFDGDGPSPVYRYTLADGALERLPAAAQRLTNVLPLPDGGLVVSTAAPSLLRLAADGRVLARAEPPNADFRFAWDAWRIDASGSRLLLPLRADGTPLRLFAPTAPPDRALRPALPGDAPDLQPPRRTPGRVEARLDDLGYQAPVRVNGRPVTLAPFQSVRSWSDGAGLVVLGTQWSVLALDAEGKRRWEQDLPAPAWQVALSGDGRWVVAAVGDGSLRWFDAGSGREVLAAFLHANGDDWIAWRPDGHYASSPGGDEFLGWLVNDGDERAPQLVRAVQLERNLYRPDLVRAAFAAAAAQPPAAGPRPVTDMVPVRSLPRVLVESATEATRTLRFSVLAGDTPLTRVAVFADDVPVLSRDAASPADGDGSLQTLTVPPGLALDRVRVEAESGRLLGFDEMAVARPWPASPRGGTLWVLAVGVERFTALEACGSTRDCAVSVPSLPNAPQDAVQLAARLRAAAAGLFSEVRVRVLADGHGERPTRAAVVAALADLQQAGPGDTTVVFLGSHGFAGSGSGGGEYWFLPADAQPADLDLVVRDAAADAAPSLLSASTLNGLLRRVPGRRLLIVDTCHAGAAGASRNPFTLAKRSASSRYAVLSASTGDELSYEYPDPKVPHGSFTWALLETLRGAAPGAGGDSDGDGLLSLDEAFRAIGPQVARVMARLNQAERRRNTAHVDFTQTPVLQAPASLRSTPLARLPRN